VGLYFLISWGVPKKYWFSISRLLVSGRQLLRHDLARRAESIETLLEGGHACACPSDIIRRYDANAFVEKLQLMRLYRPDGWTPRLVLEGGAHLERALAAGHGAILWIVPLSFHSQVTKMAFAQAGYSVNHLSRYFHGFNSYSRLGGLCINPVRTRQEERYLRQRVVIGPGDSQDVLKRLADLLRRNEIVSITVGKQGRRTSQVGFFDGKITLATGPAFLSYRTRAPLLPIFTVLESRDKFVVKVEPPLSNGRNNDAEAHIQESLTNFAAVLERHVSAFPDQFLGQYSRMWEV